MSGRVNTTEEQRHGPARSKGSNGDVIRVDASMVRDGEGSGREERSNHGTQASQ